MPRVGQRLATPVRDRAIHSRDRALLRISPGAGPGVLKGGPGSCLAPLDSNSRWSGQNVELLLAEQRIGLDTERF